MESAEALRIILSISDPLEIGEATIGELLTAMDNELWGLEGFNTKMLLDDKVNLCSACHHDGEAGAGCCVWQPTEEYHRDVICPQWDDIQTLARRMLIAMGEPTGANAELTQAQPIPDSQHAALIFNEGKPPVGMIPYMALVVEANAMGYGLAKYGNRDNWMKGASWTAYLEGAIRHCYKYLNGEDVDPESGVSHLGHARAKLAYLIAFTEMYPEGDDRPKIPVKE